MRRFESSRSSQAVLFLENFLSSMRKTRQMRAFLIANSLWRPTFELLGREFPKVSSRIQENSRFSGSRFDASDLDALGRKQTKPPVEAGPERVNMEMCGCVVCRAHHWRRGGYDLYRAASADPVDMAVAVHDHDAACERPSSSFVSSPNEQVVFSSSMRAASENTIQ
jgi:hypothetical protein